MGPVSDKDEATGPEAAAGPRASRSRMDPAALAAAEQADRIPVGRKWRPAWTLVLIVAVPAAFWALIALLLAHR